MPPKTKAPAPANGSAKGKVSAAVSTNGTTTPVSSVDKKEAVDVAAIVTGRPDKKLYDAEQDQLKGEIESLQVKLVSTPYTIG
jgi:dienelactone hydrolase